MYHSKKILIVGAGGIGSWLAFNLNNLLQTGQLSDVGITIADADDVELKNLPYQNYTSEDVFDNKAECTVQKYKEHSGVWTALTRYVTDPSDLENYDLVISAVDNTKFRKMLFNECVGKKMWIDLRAEGTTVAAFLEHPDNTLEKMLATVKVEKENQSCQRSFDMEAGTIQLGNKIIAAIGAQYVLNWSRGINPAYPSLMLNI